MIRLFILALILPFCAFAKDYSPNQLLIIFSENVDHQDALRKIGVKSFESLSPEDSSFFEGPLVVNFDESININEKLHELLESPLIKTAQFNYLYSVQLDGPPNDPLFEKQWEQKSLSVQKVWKETTDCEQKVIAVLDTGVNFLHIDLRDSMYPKNFNALDPSEKPIDYNGHGTLIASIIGAKGNNHNGVTGLCWNTKIMAIKVLNDLGDGYSSDIIKGLNFARKNNASILNLSFGSYTGEDLFLKEALKKSLVKGAIAIVPAGNQSINTDKTPFWPCSFKLKSVLCVAALDEDGNLAAFSNYGEEGIDLAAPGENIFGIAAGSFKEISDSFEKDWKLTNFFEILDGENCNFGNKKVLTYPLEYCQKNNKGSGTQWAYKNFGSDISLFDFSYVQFMTKVSGEVAFTINNEYVQKIPEGQIDFFLDLSPCRGNKNCILGFSTEDNDAKFAIWDFKIWGLKLGNSTYQKKYGSSLSAAYVSAIAALIGTYNPQFSGQDILNALKKGAKKSSLLKGKINEGRVVDPFGHLQFLTAPKWK